MTTTATTAVGEQPKVDTSQPKAESVSVSISSDNSSGVGSLAKDSNASDNQDFKQKFYTKIKQHLWLLPLANCFLLPFCCFLSYTLSIYYDHVEPVLPYVSDSGGTSPEGNHFSQCLDMLAIIAAFTFLARYKQCKYLLNQILATNAQSVSTEQIADWNQYNFITSLFGYIFSFGTLMIGNYRSTDVYIGHFIGVSLAFNSMLIYVWRMARISSFLSEFDLESKPTTMLVILAIGGISLAACVFFSLLSAMEFGWKRLLTDHPTRLKWTEDMPGYVFHVLATVFEWITINSMSPFFFCLFHRFYSFKEWNRIAF